MDSTHENHDKILDRFWLLEKPVPARYCSSVLSGVASTMRIAGLIFALVSTLGFYGCSHMNAGTKARSTSSVLIPVSTESAKTANKIDFATQIRPILESRCQPCHFSGGKVYQRMPFDRPETIKTLGTKLFTRLKDENERRVFRDFLAQE